MGRPFRVTLVMSLQNPYRRIIIGFNHLSSKKGWSSAFINRLLPDYDPPEEGTESDAFVLADQGWENMPPRFWKRHQFVAVHADLTARGIPSVELDEEAAGEVAARHLLGRGLRSYAAFAIVQKPWVRRRVAGFRRVIETRRELYLDDCDHFQADHLDLPDHHPTLRRLSKWLASIPKPAGIFACCDSWGLLMSQHCRNLGWRIPEQIAIVGVDNDEVCCEVAQPPLSSVMIPWERMGHEAARLLDRLRRGLPVPQRVVRIQPGEVVARRSTDVLAVGDPEVATALRFIQDNHTRPIGVPDLLRKIPVDRRLLERRFKQLVGRTLMQDLRRVRIERAKELLIAGELPMPEIAERIGFANGKRLSEAFRKEAGMTPAAYRSQYRLRG